MNVNLNLLMKSYNYRNKKESPSYIVNSKISEINNLSSLFTNKSNDKDNNLQKSFGRNIRSLTIKSNKKNSKQKTSNTSFYKYKNYLNNTTSKAKSRINLSKNKIPFPLKKRNKIRLFIYNKEQPKKLVFNSKNNSNQKSKMSSKSLLNNKRNISISNISISNISNKNNFKKEKTKETYFTDKSKKSLNIKTIKLIKKKNKVQNINNKYEGLSNKDFYVHFNSLLENVIRQKENEIDKKMKITADYQNLFTKIYKGYDLFKRKHKKIRKYNPILHEYFRDNTTSIENKMNLPPFYNYYINKNKKIFKNINNTYSELKNDITYDLIYDKKIILPRKTMSKKELKKEEITNDVKEMKRDIGYQKPSIELFTDKSTSYQYLTGMFDSLNKLNSSIAYQNRYYFAQRYGIDIKKDLLKIEVENGDQLYKFRKNLPPH